MKVINVINTALLMLNETDLFEYVNGKAEEQPKLVQDKELLIRSLNEALYNVSEYYSLIQSERHEPINGKIEYKKFNKK